MKFQALFIFLTAMAWHVQAASVYSFSSAPLSNDSPLSLGFVFTTNETLTVSSLGYFDAGGDGFATAHTVGIFDQCGDLLASTTLASGTAGWLEGQFRFQAIAPLTLAAGQSYTLAATTGSPDDPWAYGEAGTTLAGLSVDPRISIAADASRFLYQEDDTLRYPTDHYRYTLYAGPTFEIASDSAPEPGSALLVGMGLSGALALLRLRSRA